MSNVYARVSNGVVREVIYFDPQGDFTPDLTWILVSNSITTGANVSGNTDAVQPRWSYDGTTFTAPAANVPLPRPSGQASYVNAFSLTGKGANVWVEICNVSIIASGSTSHFLSYSTDVYDVNLYSYSTQIMIPNGDTNGGSSYGGDVGSNAIENPGEIYGPPVDPDPPDEKGGGGGVVDGAPSAGSGEGCFLPTAQVIMPDGTSKSISDVKVADVIQSDTGVVTVIRKFFYQGNYTVVSFNDSAFFVTTNHPMLTDQGWGCVDVMLFAAREPGSYQTVLKHNNYNPLVTIQPGVKLAKYHKGTIVYEEITVMTLSPRNNIEVYNLDVTGDDRYIVDGYVVHNK
jgi:hypothetical protein